MGKSNPHNDTTCFRLLLVQPEKALAAIQARYSEALRIYVQVYFQQDTEFTNVVISETLIVVWQKKEIVARLDKPFFWMQRVAEKQALYLLRKERKHNNQAWEDEYLQMVGEEHADRKLRAKEIEGLINEALDTLPPREREIFRAARFDELSNQEVMQKFNLTEQTVKNTIYRATKKLRRMLKNVLSLFV
ncbi:sigma-70 family RNA polymerase sigma factor [Sphingobacterium sp. DN00404]|uniref:Sigma-70 family RNA polymerase sigma factor n=1 Tax=Sphingobacterium micropteri TaxID=2763501 RepID=A0ABR7YSU8_9SPHI|nr:sigma-70 family RNA polymerase sigma factor [Sphingobacterium micropteri]MBD1434367.1 sigma-70 family RNA polymerase sigma factor [Sphingobacterium micropteri]